MEKYINLKVWKNSHRFILELYTITRKFPSDERFGLTQQMRRSAVSIAANIVEGSKRRSDRDYAHFLNIAEGSLEEVKYYLRLSKDLLYINDVVFEKLYSLAEEIGRLLYGFIKKLRT